jgi:fructose PTS system EIIBC or EIIC component
MHTLTIDRPPEQSLTASTIHSRLIQGVSYAIPFVVTGGVLLALGYALGGPTIGAAPPVTENFDWFARTSWAALLHQLGTLTFGLLVPVVGGYVAHAIADRPALVPGFVGGAVAVQTGAGFLGGLIAGVLAGIVVDRLARWRPPRSVAGLGPVLVLPLAGTLVTGAVMWLVVGTPLAALTSALTSRLGDLSAGSMVLLGATLGLMVAADLGGPINKTAYTFAVAGLATGSPQATTIMAAVMAAGMTPPLAMALATTIRGSRFTQAERENGRAAWLLGAVYVTEGAIPFAAADPLRVPPSLLAGSAVTGALSVALGVAAATPHGGIFVLPLVGNPLGYLVAIAAGTLVSTATVLALKSIPRRVPEDTSHIQ